MIETQGKSAQTSAYQTLFDSLFKQDVYGLSQSDKDRLLLPLLNHLHEHHQQCCSEYANIVAADKQEGACSTVNEFPYLAVRLFKLLDLRSIDVDNVFKTLQSSGTTSQTPARVYLDKETSSRQSRTLVKILQETIGKQRLPMLIIDSPAVLKDKKQFSARGAGIQGLAFFGRDHTYALDENMQLDWLAVEAFAEKYSNQPVLIFGFTFMVWLHVIEVLKSRGKRLDFSHGILLHSGGWKKLEAKKVDNCAFKQAAEQCLGVNKVYNFYGMAEQVGSVFVECVNGHLHAPVMADVIVRNPHTLEVCKQGETGIIQVLSVLPTSYPGYSLLTEDMGHIIGIDDCPCGQKGKYFAVSGRLPKTEVRGCSDTHVGNRSNSSDILESTHV